MYLIYVNPISGRGNSQKICQDYLLPYLNDNNFKLVNNLDDLTVEIDSKLYQNIICVGGDGTIADIIKILKKKKVDINIGIIPAGSGNGLAKSILYKNDYSFSISNAAQIIVRQKIHPIDIPEVKLEKDLIPWFLAISWGFVSDLDLGTEWLRFLGSLRFTLGAIYCILFKSSYPGTLEYTLLNKENKQISGDFVFFWASNVSHASSETHSAPNAELNDGCIFLSYILEPISRFTLLRIALGLEDGSYTQFVNYVPVTSFRLQPEKGRLAIDGEEIPCQTIEVKQGGQTMKLFA